jgi:hypothetical protein
MIAPYPESNVNVFYNLLFCDEPSLFRNDKATHAEGRWATLFADEPDEAALNLLAEDEHEESRIRALAYNRLRAANCNIPSKKLLGVIIEVPLEQGLDVLAAYSDGRVRYINYTRRVAIFESGPPQVDALARDLVVSSQALVNQIGPWDEPRLPAPLPGNVRITFLVSDGLYFGEGPYGALRNDPLGGTVLSKAEQLLQVAVDSALK